MTEKIDKISFTQLIKPLTNTQYWISSILFSLIIQYFFVPSSFTGERPFFLYFAWIYSIYLTQSIGNSYIRNHYINKYFSWEKTPLKKLFILITFTIFYAGIGFGIISTLFIKFIFSYSFSKALSTATYGMTYSAFISLVFAFIFASISFYINWQKSQIKAKKLEADLANYRYESLKKQVNPHFLFNSLNVLADLVHEDADLSEKYIHLLSKIYRYVLESSKKQTVPLKDEIDFIKSYAFLLDIRFGTKLKIDIDVNPKIDEFIIPVSLQTLIENAVKHNEVTKQNPLTISITKKDKFIILENNLQLKKTPIESSGTGLENLKQQYGILSDESILVEDVDGFFRVILPILK